MKRFTIILFTIFYAGLSFGVDLNLHYCGGQLAGVSVALSTPSCCCDVEMSNSDCCENAQLTIQMDTDQVNMVNPSLEDISYQLLACSPVKVFSEIKVQVNQQLPGEWPNPPPVDGQFRRIEMGSLTFYG